MTFFSIFYGFFNLFSCCGGFSNSFRGAFLFLHGGFSISSWRFFYFLMEVFLFQVLDNRHREQRTLSNTTWYFLFLFVSFTQWGVGVTGCHRRIPGLIENMFKTGNFIRIERPVYISRWQYFTMAILSPFMMTLCVSIFAVWGTILWLYSPFAWGRYFWISKCLPLSDTQTSQNVQF